MSNSNEAGPSSAKKRRVEDVASFQENNLKFGDDLTVFLEDVLGIGTHSKVFRGRYENSVPVAIKRLSLLPSSMDDAKKDINDIRELDIHHKLDDRDMENTVRYKCRKTLGSDLYIALELCDGTIDRYVYTKKNYPELNDNVVLLDIAKGVESLHKVKIAHRDIKPSNFLMKGNTMLVSDYGHAKATQKQAFSQSGIRGTIGWMAPEMCDPETTELTTASDIFQMGCLFYHIVTEGRHPFDPVDTGPVFHEALMKFAFVRQNNINRDQKNITNPLPHDRHLNCLFDLIKQMVDRNPGERPTASEIVRHPALWQEEKALKFFTAVSNKITTSRDSTPDTRQKATRIRKELELNKTRAIGIDWIGNLPDGPVKNDILKNHNDLIPNYVYNVLRVIRNKHGHWNQLPPDVQGQYQSLPQGYVRYWTNAFPGLLMYSHGILSQYKADDDLKEFY